MSFLAIPIKYLVPPCAMIFCGIGPAFAGNVAVIQQVGPGSVEVNQSGKGNSVEIHQSVEMKGTAEKKGSADKPEKADKKPPAAIVDCKPLPETSQRVRAQVIIRQQGDTNQATTSQNSQVSTALIEQEGKHNSYISEESGKLHRNKVIQNGATSIECGAQQ